MHSSGKVLVTGASGFIGSRLVQRLLDADHSVVTIRRDTSPAVGHARSVVGDYSNVEQLAEIFRRERPTTVLHVAGVTKGRTYDDFERGNVMPTRNLLLAIKQSGISVQRFLLVSSLTSHGPSSNAGRPLIETDPQHPVEFYGKSKMAAERVVMEEANSIPWTIVQPAGVYGPGDSDYFNLFKSAYGGVNAYFGNEDRSMSIIYVDDCVDAILRAAISPNAVGHRYFLSTGEPVTWGEFQSTIVANIGRRVRTIRLPEFLVGLAAAAGEALTALDGKPRLFNRQKAIMGQQAAWTCSNIASVRDFSYTPKVDLRDGIVRSHRWYLNQGWY